MFGSLRQTYQPTRIPLALAPAPSVPSAKQTNKQTNTRWQGRGEGGLVLLHILSPISPRARSLCEHQSTSQSKEEAGGIARLNLGSTSGHRDSILDVFSETRGLTKQSLELETQDLEKP